MQDRGYPSPPCGTAAWKVWGHPTVRNWQGFQSEQSRRTPRAPGRQVPYSRRPELSTLTKSKSFSTEESCLPATSATQSASRAVSPATFMSGGWAAGPAPENTGATALGPGPGLISFPAGPRDKHRLASLSRGTAQGRPASSRPPARPEGEPPHWVGACADSPHKVTAQPDPSNPFTVSPGALGLCVRGCGQCWAPG